MQVSFIGLGVMGGPMAGHLAKNGHKVCGYNRTAARAERWAQTYKAQGVTTAKTPADASQGAQIVMVCVGDDDDVRKVVYGADGSPQAPAADGILAQLAQGAILIDHTTASASLAKELDAVCKARKIDFIDAPVSGGQSGAENGVLTVMAGGTPQVFARTQEVVASYAKSYALLGPVGAGQLTKMVNQICIAGVVQGLSEAIHFGQKAGLDIDKVLAIIAGGAAQSWQMENRGKTMARDEFDFGFAVDWMRKDLRIILTQARQTGASLPMTAAVDQFYAAIQARGGGRWDTSSLIRLLNKTP
ncbi:MAG: NAD(P)-dependent oxidoreductase [Pseudomonadota bacterium]